MSANLASLERRLRKLEECRTGSAAIYLAWGITRAKANGALQHARDIGTVAPRDEAVALVWPDDTPAPLSRWVLLGRKHEEKFADRELEILIETFEIEAVRRERAAAAAKGEDLSDLDDTDVRIRIMRRESRDLTGDLRMLAIRKNPHVKTHWAAPGTGLVRACECPTCLTGETAPHVQYPIHRAKFQAWLDRYVPNDGLFA
ncbi:hypothetical protein MKK75_03735 [Methylobacterium sp. J-030]|uniref:hypothetical protein n=1 Tax=Methylobacterium sp. J-030 TaxID=2836627 RepID=UPI001FBA302C|nr:hypothetical protein [Methylobacterium sp. J-030]MCJ2067926.1 hypothetical protein [Methylobacterium sp. J-030]